MFIPLQMAPRDTNKCSLAAITKNSHILFVNINNEICMQKKETFAKKRNYFYQPKKFHFKMQTKQELSRVFNMLSSVLISVKYIKTFLILFSPSISKGE